MEIFIGIKNDLRRMGCLQYDHPYKKSINFAQYFIFVSSFVVLLITSLWFLFFGAETFIEYVKSYIPFISALHILLTYCDLLWQRNELLELMMEVEHIIGNRDQLPLYQMAHLKIEKWTKTKNTVWIIVCLFFASPKFFLFIYGQYLADSPDEYYHLIFPGSFPFDLKSPFGYIIAMIFQSAGTFLMILTSYNIVLITVAHCVFLIAFCSDLENEIRVLNKNFKFENGKKKKCSTSRLIELKKQLCEVIQFQCDAKQCAFETSKLYNRMFFLQFSLAVSYSFVGLLQIHEDLKSNNLADMVEPMSGGSAYMFWFFILCNFGENVTNRFTDLNDSIYDVWYLYPVDQQKYLSLMILNAEQPVYMEGFIIQSSREAFKKVINTMFSYYMTLRQFI